MMPWTRPDAHEDFERDARKALADFQAAVSAGTPHHKAFKGREIWTGSWTRRSQPRGVHKTRLQGGAELAKCVWCEQVRELGRELDVEHYRPKGAVTEWTGNPVFVSDTPPAEIEIENPGYWWLAFRWTNFALACKPCNETWKRNLFPIRQRLTLREGIEHSEQPLLLDPASGFRTRDHFSWHDHTGIIAGISDEGRATIITCGLNRKSLLTTRGKVARRVIQHADDLIRAFKLGDTSSVRRHELELAVLGASDAEFTGMNRWLVERRLGAEWEQLGLGEG